MVYHGLSSNGGEIYLAITCVFFFGGGGGGGEIYSCSLSITFTTGFFTSIFFWGEIYVSPHRDHSMGTLINGGPDPKYLLSGGPSSK